MERLEVDLLVGQEQVAVEMVEGKHTSDQHIRLLEHSLLRHTLYEAFIECLLIELINDALVYLLLAVVGLLLASFVQQSHPILQVLHALVGRPNFYFFYKVPTNIGSSTTWKG